MGAKIGHIVSEETRKKIGLHKELWDLDNGVTLCKECHNLTKKGGIMIRTKVRRLNK